MDSHRVCLAYTLALFVLGVRSAQHHNCPALFDDYRNGDSQGLNSSAFKRIFIPTFDTEFPADGQLSRDEVVSGWRSGHCDFQDTGDGLLIFLESDLDRDMFVTDNDLNQLFHQFDRDHSGHISVTEFIDGWSRIYGRHTLYSLYHHS